MIWLVLPTFGKLGVEPPRVFADNIGVVMLMEGRLLRAAGSISGMVIRESATASRAAERRGATQEKGHGLNGTNGLKSAIAGL